MKEDYMLPEILQTDYALLGIAFFCMHLLGIVNALHAVSRVRTSQGTVAWVLFLITFPYFAIPLYWIFGPTKFYSYTSKLDAAATKYRGGIEKSLHPLRKVTTQLEPQHRATQQLFEEISQWPLTSGNEVKLLIDGEETFDAIVAAILSAEKYVLIEFYTVRNDGLGRRIKEALIKRVHEGVRVYFLYDQIGSLALANSYIDELKDAGIEIEGFRTTKGRNNRFKLNFRNHRKIVVVDGKHAFIGGHNIGDEYLGKNPRFGPWRDTHLSLMGPAVLGVQASFTKDWYWACETIPDLCWELPVSNGQAKVLPIATGPVNRFESCTLMFYEAICSARKRLWIATPYFVPDEGTLLTLKLAALRGVDVRLLIPRKPDNIMVYLAGVSYLEPLLEAGIRVLRYNNGFLHQKTFLIDDHLGAVGTANLDNRSLRLNFEITMAVFDAGFVTEMESMFENDFNNSIELTLEDCRKTPYYRKMAGWVCRLFAPIL